MTALALDAIAGRPARKVMEADYVIVGAGSAGWAIAYRLAEDGRLCW